MEGSWAGKGNDFGTTAVAHWEQVLRIEPANKHWEEKKHKEAAWCFLCTDGWGFYYGPEAECEWALMQLAKLREGDELPYELNASTRKKLEVGDPP